MIQWVGTPIISTAQALTGSSLPPQCHRLCQVAVNSPFGSLTDAQYPFSAALSCTVTLPSIPVLTEHQLAMQKFQSLLPWQAAA